MANELIKTVLVDDEKDAIDLLAQLLNDFPEIRVVGTAYDARQAYQLITQKEPDLVFLDIQMPRETGLDLAEKIKDLPKCPAIIFVTAYDQYAISAIKQAALDYVLKPVDRSKLKEAITRYKNLKKQKTINERIEDLFNNLVYPRKLKFSTRAGFLMLDPEEVIYCHAEGNYTEIYTAKGEKEIVTTNLGKLEKTLPENIFYRMSRFHIVNIHFIKRIDRKKQLCELGVNGTLHSLSIPKNKIKELETRLTAGL